MRVSVKRIALPTPARLVEAVTAARELAGPGLSSTDAVECIRVRFQLDDVEAVQVADRVEVATAMRSGLVRALAGFDSLRGAR